MKFLVDEDLSEEIANILRASRMEAVHVREIGLAGADDREVLDEAARRGCCVVTRNRNDFLALTEMYFHENRPHSGVLIITRAYPGNRPERIAKAMLALRKSRSNPTQPYGFAFL